LHLSAHLAGSLAVISMLVAGCGDSGSRGGAASSPAEPGPGSFVAAATHAHAVAGETCFICDASKRDPGRLWCREHARYEDRCWLCHPELEEKDRLFCEEHGLYEDECHLCDPGRASGGAGAGDQAALFCVEHGVPEIECGICQPDLAGSLPPGGTLKVRFPSDAAAGKAGVQTARPRVAEAAPSVAAYCEVQFNANTMARVVLPVQGILRDVRHDLGDRVEAGEILAVLDAAEVAAAKSAYLSAVVECDVRGREWDREQSLQAQQITAEAELLRAEAAYRTACLQAGALRQRLLHFGLTADEIARIEAEEDASAALSLRAPLAGTIVERSAVTGEAIDAGQTLFTVADLSTRWLDLSIPSDRIHRIAPGQHVDAHFPELPGTTVSGRLTWVDPSVDPQTRMVRARAVVTEGTGPLKTGLFGEAAIRTGEARSAMLVPHHAVQHHEGAAFVFVQEAADLFALRRVTVGDTQEGAVQILAGLAATDPVVGEGSFIAMSEFLKSRLGAGCVHE
jgi:cobalt-zinc-cadmium efflux system membrane fusion protein